MNKEAESITTFAFPTLIFRLINLAVGFNEDNLYRRGLNESSH